MIPPSILPPNFKASPELLAQAVPNPGEVVAAPTYPEGFDFKSLQEKVTKLSSQGKRLQENAVRNRKYRTMEVDNEEERSRGRFSQDEIYIPYHVINDNIGKESGSYISFITESRNVGTFKKKGATEVTNNEVLESEFSNAVRYEGYEQEVFGLIDGFMLHGIDYLEVIFDESKPGHFSFEHLAYENVWYPSKVQRGKFQDAPIIVRNCEVTKDKLLAYPNINKEQVELLFKDGVKNDPEKEFAQVQKVFYRINGIVHVCWMSYEKSTDFLRAPQPLHMGRVEQSVDMMGNVTITKIYESQYFIAPFPYQITENKCLIDTLGRARLDMNTQEAVSSMVSSIVNSWHKASQTMGSPADPTSSPSIEALDVVIQGGRIYNKRIEFWSHPYPDADGMNIVNALLTQNKAETAQMNLAVGNRSDYASRKTAKEIQVAERKEAQLTTTQVVLFSSSWREVLRLCWLIMSSQIKQGLIVSSIPPETLQEEWMILAAGETEVVKRQEILANLQNLWPVVSTTTAAMPVLEDILRLMVPSSADKYIAALRMAGGDDKAIIQQLLMLVTAIAKEHPEVIPPDSYEMLGQLIEQAQLALTVQQPGQQPVEQEVGEPKEAPAQ